MVASPYCRFELDAFLAREAALGRDDLVFPILYIDVPALEDSGQRQNDPVLSLIAKRQYVDWREFRYLGTDDPAVRKAVGRFCMDIRDALHRPWLSPEERAAQEKAAALQLAEDERKRQEAEARRREEETRKRAEAVQERERADQERRQRDAEVERRRAEEQRLRDESEAERRAEEKQRRAEEEQRRQLRRSQTGRLWSPLRLALVVIIGLVMFGAIVIAYTPRTPAPATPPKPVWEDWFK